MIWAVISSHDPSDIITEKDRMNINKGALNVVIIRGMRFNPLFEPAIQRLEN
jgi:hypothetical protein